jgi:hypothetical protein
MEEDGVWFFRCSRRWNGSRRVEIGRRGRIDNRFVVRLVTPSGAEGGLFMVVAIEIRYGLDKRIESDER